MEKKEETDDTRLGGNEWEQASVCVSACVCVRERESVCVWVWVCVSLSVWERECVTWDNYKRLNWLNILFYFRFI